MDKLNDVLDEYQEGYDAGYQDGLRDGKKDCGVKEIHCARCNTVFLDNHESRCDNCGCFY